MRQLLNAERVLLDVRISHPTRDATVHRAGEPEGSRAAAFELAEHSHSAYGRLEEERQDEEAEALVRNTTRGARGRARRLSLFLSVCLC